MSRPTMPSPKNNAARAGAASGTSSKQAQRSKSKAHPARSQANSPARPLGSPAVVARRVYPASRTKAARASQAEMQARRDALEKIVAEIAPCTVRQCFYQASVRGVVEKTEAGYDKV